MTPQSPAPVAGDEPARPASEQPVEAVGAGREEGDYTMALAERQAFENHPDLAAHIERMAMSGRLGSHIEWDGFLREMNAALSPASPARTPMGGEVEALREALMAAQSFIADGGLAESEPGASIYRQITQALAASSPSPAQGGSDWKAEWEAVCSARIADRERSQEIINERDGWIVDLIGHRKALVACVREAMKEAIPDAMIFAAHTDPKRWSKAKDDFQAWMKRSADLLDAIESERAAPPSVQPVKGK